jgi:hypothetical protein
MKRLLVCGPLAVALALAGCDGTATDPLLRPSFDRGGGQGLNLQPGGFGDGSLGAWKSQQGLPDNKGNGNFALYLQKLTTTATNAAGFAVITGLEGQAVSALTYLAWDHRTPDGHCGAGAPRWDVFVKGLSNKPYTLFLGCAAAIHTPVLGAPVWTTDSYSGAAIVTVGGANAGLTADEQIDAAGGTITGLIIVFDEGTDQGEGFVFLDNITVIGKTWTSPGDNGT